MSEDPNGRAQAPQAPQAPKLKRRQARELLHKLELQQSELKMKDEALRKMQAELDKTRDRFVDFHDCIPAAYLSLNREGAIVEINRNGAALLGMARGKLSHKSFAHFVAAEDRDRWLHYFLNVLARGDTPTCELALQRGDGLRLYAQLSCRRSAKNGDATLVRILLTDLTRHKADEAKILRQTGLYNALSQCNEAIVRCASEHELFEKICDIAVQVGGMKIAWIGLLDETGKKIVPVASCGAGAEFLEGLHLRMDRDSPRGPTATSIYEDQPYWCQDFMNDPVAAPWHEKGARYGLRALAALPLHRNGNAIGSLILYSGFLNVFDEAIQKLLLEMAGDISHALDIFATDAEHKRAEQALRESERNLQVAQRLANIGSWKWILATDIMQWSEELCRINGYDPELPVPGFAKMASFYTPESRKRLNEAVQRTIEHGESYQLELDLVHADGAMIKTCSRGEADYDADGKLVSLHGMVQDITEIKRAEEAMARYAHDMHERAREAACLRDITAFLSKKEWNIEFIIDSCIRRIPGGFSDPLRTSTRIAFDGQIFESPNFRKSAWKLAAAIPLSTRHSGAVEVFYAGDESDGAKDPFLDEQRGLISSIAFQLAQSLENRWAEEALKRQNEKFIGMLEVIADGIYIENRNYDIEYVNPAIEREYGKVEGQKCYTYFHGRTEPCPWCKNEEVFKDHTVLWQWHSDKTGRDYDMFDTPIINPDGSVSKFEMFHDITKHLK